LPEFQRAGADEKSRHKSIIELNWGQDTFSPNSGRMAKLDGEIGENVSCPQFKKTFLGMITYIVIDMTIIV
jgi:hypothetical protein